MTMMGEEGEEGDDCARSMQKYIGAAGMELPYSVVIISMKLPSLSIDKRVSGS